MASVRLYTRAHIGREQNKSRTATEDDPILVWVSFLAHEDKRINDSQRQRFCTCEKHIKELSVFALNRSNRTSEILKMNLTLR